MFLRILRTRKSISNAEKCTNCRGTGKIGDWKFNIVGIDCGCCGGSGDRADQERIRLAREAKAIMA